ncbi:MAG: NAD(P)-binding protein [Gemmatimonadales bacterium]
MRPDDERDPAHDPMHDAAHDPAHDRALGMGCPITRRDFVNGMAVAAGAALVPGLGHGHPWWAFQEGVYAPERDPHYYPPGLGGLRGDHAGSFEVAHQMRDGGAASLMTGARPTNETFDLIVVGGGISGLAAAHFYRKSAGPSARILVIDNHDDFGGHAKRNEFQVDGQTLIGYGGAQSLDGPANYSAVARGVLADAGVEPMRFHTAFDQQFYASRHLGDSVFFDKETFGADHLATGAGSKPWADVLAGAPLSEVARRDIARLYDEERDYLPGLTRAQKRARLARMSYRDYLLHVAGVTPDALPYFQRITADLWCAGIDVISAISPYNDGFRAGYRGMGLGDGDPPPGTHLGPTPPDGEDPYIFHFPDGNASLARLLVRRLIPAAAAGHTMDDIVTARVNYAQLDDPAHPVRVRLNSTAVRVRHMGDPASAHEVEVTYVRGGKAWTVRAPHVVLACWNSVSAYLCPELPEPQRHAMLSGVKEPFVYTNVALRNWNAWSALATSFIYAPGSYYSIAELDFPVSLGTYHFARSPADPIVVHMLRAPCAPGLPRRELYRAGRAELLATPFEVMERNTRNQLARMLGGGGGHFDPARDIAAITVNRWAHGYAYEYDPYSDPPPPAGQVRPCVTARQPFGRITIANSDAGASAYANSAIDQAHRAVVELGRKVTTG